MNTETHKVMEMMNFSLKQRAVSDELGISDLQCWGRNGWSGSRPPAARAVIDTNGTDAPL